MRSLPVRRFVGGVVAYAALSVVGAACSPGGAEPAGEGGREVLASRGEPQPGKLAGRSGSPGSLWGQAIYEGKRKSGTLVEDFEVQVKNARPGVVHAVTLDGKEIGRMTTDLDGEAELEFGGDGEPAFPADLPRPKVGSLVRVGELLELRLEPLEELVLLEAVIKGAGPAGKISFKVERLGGQITREFKVKLAGAPRDSAQPVRVDGVHVGDLTIKSNGEGKLEFSETDGKPFPASFPELRGRSKIQIGNIVSGEFEDLLAARKE